MNSSFFQKTVRWLLFIPFAFIGYLIVIVFIGKLLDIWYRENILIYIFIGYVSGGSFMAFGEGIAPLKNKYILTSLFFILFIFVSFQTYATYVSTGKIFNLVTLQSFFTLCGASMICLMKWNYNTTSYT